MFGPTEAMILASVVIGAILFLVLRALFLWYFRVNEIVVLLARIAAAVERANPPSPPSA